METLNKGSMSCLPTETCAWCADSEVKMWAFLLFFSPHPNEVVFVLHGNGNEGRVAEGLSRGVPCSPPPATSL